MGRRAEEDRLQGPAGRPLPAARPFRSGLPVPGVAAIGLLLTVLRWRISGDSRDVHISVSRADGSVSIAVRDNGIGIPVS